MNRYFKPSRFRSQQGNELGFDESTMKWWKNKGIMSDNEFVVLGLNFKNPEKFSVCGELVTSWAGTANWEISRVSKTKTK